MAIMTAPSICLARRAQEGGPMATVKPTIGKIVHFIGTDGLTYAAIVTAVREDPSRAVIDLAVFYPVCIDRLHGIPQQREPAELGCWKWPEVVK